MKDFTPATTSTSMFLRSDKTAARLERVQAPAQATAHAAPLGSIFSSKQGSSACGGAMQQLNAVYMFGFQTFDEMTAKMFAEVKDGAVKDDRFLFETRVPSHDGQRGICQFIRCALDDP